MTAKKAIQEVSRYEICNGGVTEDFEVHPSPDGEWVRYEDVEGLLSARAEAQDEDTPCTDCGDTGVTHQTERRCSCQEAEAQNEGAAGETVEWLGGGNYEPTKAMIEAGLDHNHRHNSEANMVASFKSMMVQAEIDGLINPAHPSPTPAADADRVREAIIQAVSKGLDNEWKDWEITDAILAALKSEGK